MKQYFLLLACLVIFLTTACTDDDSLLPPPPPPCTTTCDYLYLGHIYEEQNTVDRRIEQADLSRYSQIWLGGDLCSETTKEEATLTYLDSLFDLSSKNTHWAVGNHDLRNGNWEWITNRTGRDIYYSEYNKGFTFLVLNSTYTDPADCQKMEVQTNLLHSVCDTISQSSHLIILMHSVTWGYVDGIDDPNTWANTDASWIDFNCEENRFEQIIYPELVEVQERGVQVVCIAGDMGQEASTYEQTTDDGVVFLASGITSDIEWNQQWATHGQRDSVLILTHDMIQQNLTWKFIDIDDI